ncbi:MAG TPA: phospholipase D family protein [Geminicoccaceae bacterium]|nr:phospholipase D family protein [Geminicoccaceae bacterium]
MQDLFGAATGTEGAAGPGPSLRQEPGEIELFEAALTGRRTLRWRVLFEGFRTLRAITFSTSVPALLDVVELFEEVEITFGSERVLSREAAALEQATTAMGYRFVDALADQKAFIERFVRPALSRGGERLLARVQDGTLRFRLLRKLPSHEKLYLLEGDARWRVVLGSANLSLAALTGRQKETFVAFDGEEAHRTFLDYYGRDTVADPVDADLLVVPAAPNGDGRATVATEPVALTDVPCLRVLKAGAAIVEEPRPGPVPELSAAALREASRLGAELQSLVLERNRSGATVVNAASFAKAYRAHGARPLTEKTDRVPEARIDLAAGLVTLDGRPWHRLGAPVPWPEVRQDAALLAPYFAGFGQFYGDAAGVQRSYWALTCWLYAAPFAPVLRSAALRHDGSPLAYPVHAVLYGRSDGGKTMFSRVVARSMFAVEQMVRGQQFTASRALGLRDQLGAIPLLVDDVDRGRFAQYVPDLVKFDHESGESYAPILISTNRDVTAIPPDLRKRMVVCHIDGARPRGISEAPARQALARIGTALYRTYLDRLVPRVPGLIEAIGQDPLAPPDLLRVSSEVLGGLLAEALDEAPAWAAPLGLGEVDRLKDKPLLDMLNELVEQNHERVSVNRATGEILVSFAGDHHQAGRFEKLVPAQALKGRFTDTVKLDLVALEQEYGFSIRRPARSWLFRLLRR